MFENWFPQDMTTLRKLLWFRSAWGESGKPPVPSDPLNTFVGSIVRFFSHRALPVVQLEANFTPIQSLNGYDNPWPAGGGKNKFGGEYNENFPLFIPAGTTVTAYSDVNLSINYYKSDGTTRIDYWSVSSAGRTFTILEDSYYFRFSGASTTPTKMYIAVENSFSGYEPYSNICPISGHTGAEVVRTGKNLCESYANAYVSKVTNDSVYLTGTGTTLFFKCVAGETYTVSGVTITRGNFAVYDAIPTNGQRSSNDGTFTVGEPASFTTQATGICAVYVNNTLVDTSTAQIELGSTASAYEAFQGTTVSISSGTTVYGGQLTVFEDGSGQVVADKAGHVFDGTETIEVDSDRFRYTVSPAAPLEPSNVNAISSIFKSVTASNLYSNRNTSGYIGIAINAQNLLMIDNVNFPTKDTTAFKAYLATQYANGKPFTAVWKLATPVTIPLTASQINTLVGTNTIWVNDATGDITVQAYGTEIV